MISSLLVHHYPLSRSVRVVWLLNELGVEFQTRHVKLFLGEGRTEEYLKMNPNHAVPVLQYKLDGETHTIIESSAIVRFIATYADRLPRKAGASAPQALQLLPDPAKHSMKEVAEFEQWFAFCSVTLDSCLWSVRVINDFRDRIEERELLQVYIDKWNTELLPQLNQRFEENPSRQYVMDWGFSLIDVVLGQTLNWSRKYRFLDPFGPKLKEYEKRIRSRPALMESVKDGHLFEKDSKI